MACFISVMNAPDLKERLQAQDKTLTFAMVESNLIMDVFQLLTAATKAAVDNEAGKLSTQSLNSEIIYNLSPTKNIAESLKRFGITEDTKSLIAVRIGGNPDEVLADMSKTVDGILVSFSKLDQEKDMAKLRQYYKIDPKMTEDKAILNWIIGAMAMKNIQ
ncbi:kinase binding protein CGI-121-domain-containing protein [Gamsiella multidivaricata]|uniref:kinase binding protein CGI-121-domain-containing protein n=1 Tax=Gamsiella multidivaricata TaxID=101098 RepID=UPI00222051DA|nr:kinase binding protein CGI-121-domain-containing protein [Gamsiella multidivaricata]KAI7832262.1 kinase binding protein CGI-121-domain-containing protein [Gamsiella multidivaricata]